MYAKISDNTINRTATTVEDTSEWTEIPDPPNADPPNGYTVSRTFDVEENNWTVSIIPEDEDSLRRNYLSDASVDNLETTINAVSDADTQASLKELAHILTGDNRFE